MITTIIQDEIKWEDIDANISSFEVILKKYYGKTDLVVLPEMFNTGFTMNPVRVAEEPFGKTYKWLQKISTEGNFAITGSYAVKEDEKYFNRLFFITPKSENTFYNKRHLFRMAKEDKVYSSGSDKKAIVDYRDWKICPLVCYDLRFPVWSRNTEGYHLLIYVANWPEPRVKAWTALLKARAIENQCYVIGVNRIGEDEKGISYSGDSVCFDYKGVEISSIGSHNQVSESIPLNMTELLSFREKFPVWMDADDFEIEL